jgi:hypothetical protein
VLRVREESGRVVMKRQMRRGGCYALGVWRRTIETGFDSKIVFKEMLRSDINWHLQTLQTAESWR